MQTGTFHYFFARKNHLLKKNSSNFSYFHIVTIVPTTISVFSTVDLNTFKDKWQYKLLGYIKHDTANIFKGKFPEQKRRIYNFIKQGIKIIIPIECTSSFP